MEFNGTDKGYAMGTVRNSARECHEEPEANLLGPNDNGKGAIGPHLEVVSGGRTSPRGCVRGQDLTLWWSGGGLVVVWWWLGGGLIVV